MTLKTYSGSCQCGAVCFEADIDLAGGTNRCNCSFCAKARAWFTLVSPDHFRQLSGEDAQTEYQWIPEGHPASNLYFRFCSACGVRTAGLGDHGPGGGPVYFVSVASLDNADPDDLAPSIRYLDGRKNRYGQTPDDVRLL